MAPLVYAMGFVHHGIFQTAVGLQTLAQHLDERVASEAFRRHVQQHNAVVQHTLHHLCNFVCWAVAAEVVGRIRKT